MPLTVDDLGEIPVRRTGGEIVMAKCSPEDYEYLSQFHWSLLNKGGYAFRRTDRAGKRLTWYMHREVLGLEHGNPLVADHINGDRLDNRRDNLRALTVAENRQNTLGRDMRSRYRGVRHAGTKKEGWVAFSHVDGKFIYLGTFPTEQEAARVASDFRAANLPFTVEARHPIAS